MLASLKQVNNQLVCDIYKFQMLVPERFSNLHMLEQSGKQYLLFACVTTRHYFSESDTKPTIAFMNLPVTILTQPTEITNEKLDLGNGMQKYLVFSYYKNDVVIHSTDIIQNGNNLLTQLRNTMQGYMSIVPYDQIESSMILAKIYNSVNFKVPNIFEEIIIAEYYRSNEDISIPARYEAAVTTKKPYYAKGISQRTKVSNDSTFAAITFEDMSVMLTKANNDANDGKEEMVSEIEKAALNVK